MPLFLAGLWRDRGMAERVIRLLLDAGVPSSEVSLVVREKAEEDMADREGMGEETFGKLAVHSAWERLGWLGGARPPYQGTIAPDIDFALIAAGPLAIAIGGAQLGACSGGVVGAMSNFGFPLDLATRWYDAIVDGRAWVMVRTEEQDAETSRRIFSRYPPDLPAESLRHW